MIGNIAEITGNFVTLHIPAGTDDLIKYKDKELTIEIKEKRNKRSLDANGYYWQLVNKMAEALLVTNAQMHNMLLRRYGTLEEIDGNTVFVEIPADSEDEVIQAEEYHLKPISRGGQYDTYAMIKGSRRYNSKEMARLIDGTVDEAKMLGIETRTPSEIAEMIALIEQRERKRP